ncbi:MAG: hypothetical protein DFNUSKGM_001275 [Candidatus Fervidibacter sacchari]
MSKTLSTRQKRNWKDYNNQLKQRASLQIWLGKEVIDGWTKGEGAWDKGQGTRNGKRKRGHPFLYSEIAIKFLA